MKLLYFIELYPHKGKITGGVENRAWNITRSLAKRGHEVTVLTSHQPGQPRKENVDGVNVHRVGATIPYSNSGAIFKRLSYVTASFLRARRIKADIVEGYSFLTYIPANITGLLKRKPRIATYHETWIGSWVKNKGIITGTLGSMWERFACALPWTKVFSVSKTTADQLTTRAPIEILYNGVDLKRLKKVKPGKKTDIILVTRLTKKKNVNVFLKALALLPKDTTATVIGQGPEQEQLKRQAKQLKVQVNWRGYVENYEDVLQSIKAARVFCLPSELEGFGIVIAEALALGTPVVCTEIPCLKEVAQDAAVTVPIRDEKSLAVALERVLTRRKLRIELKQEGLRRVQAFDWDTIIKNIEYQYKSLQR